MVKGFLLFIVSVCVWIARRSGEQFGYKKALSEIEAATKGELLDLQTRIAAKQKLVEERHAEYEDKLPPIWPASGVIELRKLKEDRPDPETATSSDLLDFRD